MDMQWNKIKEQERFDGISKQQKSSQQESSCEQARMEMNSDEHYK